jgi:DNA-binding response OmpR family regulator
MAHRILIVDDDPQARLLLTYILKRKGFEVLEAEDGPSALLRVGKDRADLVLLDVMMPGMDVRGVQHAAPNADYRRLPIVMLTAKTDADAQERGMRAGASDYHQARTPTELVARIRPRYPAKCSPAGRRWNRKTGRSPHDSNRSSRPAAASTRQRTPKLPTM